MLRILKVEYYEKKLKNATLIIASASIITACQTPAPHNQTTEIIAMPTVVVNLYSDGDGIYDELDVCPGTEMNLIVDNKGCPKPFSFHMGEEDLNKTRVFYLENSSEISAIDTENLDSIVDVIREYPNQFLLIEAHIGRFEYVKGSNSLARSRAERFSKYIIANYKIDPQRIGTYYCSYYRPYTSNDDPETRHNNQRVEIRIQSILRERYSECERFNYQSNV